LRLAVLAALPLAGLAGLWAITARTYHQGTEWDVPVAGYDPRDILRGHYVEFEYDWPGYGRVAWGSAQTLCLEGTAPVIASVAEARPGAACPHPVRTDPDDLYGTSGTARGRLYVGQERARQLEQGLRSGRQRGVVTIRQRDDGSFTAIAIRLRALTAAEAAERAAAASPAE
jgi:hypothetical protein